LAKYAADRVRTVSNAWLGSTMGCAECHDHKFDPFTTKDFYSLEAFFADVRQWGVYADYTYTPNPDLKGINNDSQFPPEIEVTSPYLVRRDRKLRRQIAELAAGFAGEGFEAWCRAAHDELAKHPDGWSVPAVAGVNSATEDGKVLDDGSVLLTGAVK